MRTRVGYAGGTKCDPTYRDLGDHTEVFQLDFDPARISFRDLLAAFWDEHDPCRAAWSRQYAAILFYHGDAQREAALASVAKLQERLGRPVRTELRALDRFYRAEDYHQKYSLRRHRALTAELRRLFSTEREFVDATAVAKVHAWVDGHLSYEALVRELEAVGWRAVGQGAKLERIERIEQIEPAAETATRRANSPTRQDPPPRRTAPTTSTRRN